MTQKSFTLFEIIISIILITIIYIFAINSFSNSVAKRAGDITLENLKEKLLKFDFQNQISVKCIEDDFSCFIFIDGQKEPIEEKIEKLFLEKPTIYHYDKDLERVEFPDLELEQLQRYEVVFEYSCKKNNRCSELVVENQDEIYLFNDIYTKPIKLKYLSDVEDLIEKNIQEVRDAF